MANDTKIFVDRFVREVYKVMSTKVQPSGCFKLPDTVFTVLSKGWKELKQRESLSIGVACEGYVIECVTFKKGGKCLASEGFKYKDYTGKIKTCLHHSVLVVRGCVVDFATGVNGLPLMDYLNSLYQYNENRNIRIDTKVLYFGDFPDKLLPKEAKSLLFTREGLDYETFQAIRNKYNKNSPERRLALSRFKGQYPYKSTRYYQSVLDFASVFKTLAVASGAVYSTVTVSGNFNVLNKDGEVVNYKLYSVMLMDDYTVYDPISGWSDLSLDVWISMLAPINPDNKFKYGVYFDDAEDAQEFLNISTTGDLDALSINGSNCILSKTMKSLHSVSILSSMLMLVEDKSLLDISSLMAFYVLSSTVIPDQVKDIIDEIEMLEEYSSNVS